MKILINERCSGKTITCIRTLRENPDAIMFVLTMDMAKTLPKDIQDRVFPIKSHMWVGQCAKKAIIDNIEFMPIKTIQAIQTCFEIILVTATFDPKSITHIWTLFGDTDEYGYCSDCDRPDCDNCDMRMPDEPMRNEGYD